MKFILQLAAKNLMRYKRRTAITAVAIAFGLMMYVFVDSLLLGAELESMRNLRWYETASLRVHDSAYWEDRYFLPLDASIESPQPILDLLKAEGITATARTSFAADMILYQDDFGEDGNMSVQVTAINPATDFDVYRFENTLIEGRFLQSGEMDGIVLGSWFAEDIGAKVGYWVTLVTRGKGGFYEAFDMEIVGIINCPNPNVNRSLVMMDIQAADLYLAMDGSISSIDIVLGEKSNLNEVVQSLQPKLQAIDADLTLYTWEDLARDYLAILEAKQGGTGMILFLVFIIAAVGVSNTMLMAMYERMRELGMMRALGMRDRDILLAFLFEAGGIGLLGSVVGILLGCLANLYLVNVGFDFGFMLRDMDIGFRIQNVMRGAWSIPTLIKAFLSGIGLSMIVAFLPIRRALKLDIPTCLHHQ
ncbi:MULTISPECIES: FtsX-like permease family protein [Sphaerochaeta]|jgi:ABC-type lipoprotein release transport system permease subunit|uniref:Macrolide export ATP-binding/permease protein MacB n=1 Tax=bioreactor metagenome TaxID=1076179 RepID=A0A644W3G1_9ZZZZ|nr:MULTISPECIES: FtsX-like permease family protein [Sphaerochaeta]MDD3424583.1 FtsX-like permease family protein [Sphaerochaeta sp.]MDD3457557.1 FtsX-like permease family protein [Sphaerochaeta sp.]MDD4037205.1 FtsX-like permease family protein [Sphaerochaeta sp.]MEA5029239.1 FtsX-like permease family protein [Sphaerochaeta associata]MEA5107545.1 FtsX-like permease family protein [Sphaerochaeta associata]